jgi:iron-sulfur cluster assembly protein
LTLFNQLRQRKLSKLKIINISNKAAKEINSLIEKKKISNEYSLRVGIRGAGCSGARHFLAFDKKKSSDDQQKINGIQVVYEKKQALYLAGYRIEFEENEKERGFFFAMEQP